MYKKLSNKTATKATASLQKRAFAIFVAIALACTSVAAPASAFADEVVEPLELTAPEAAVAEDAADEAEDFAVEEDEVVAPLAEEVAPLAAEPVVDEEIVPLATAGNVTQFNQQLAAALTNGTEHVITLTANISLGTANAVINSGKNITLKGNFTLSSSNRSGTISVRTGAKLTLDGSTVTNIASPTDYAEAIDNSGTLIMKSGRVTSSSCYGISNSGSFTMTGGTVSNCKNHGVYNFNVFAMTGGTITGNEGAGVVNSTSKTFNMSGGVISSNRDSGIQNFGTVNISNGTISYNSSNYTGGGIHNNSGTVTMSGGLITGNTSGNGGGVYTFSAVFTMTGGTISNNTATSYSGGGGVYVWDKYYSYVTIGAGATFAGNKARSAYGRPPAYNSVYNAKIKCTRWTAPHTQGYNNVDISNTTYGYELTKPTSLIGSKKIVLNRNYKKTTQTYRASCYPKATFSIKVAKKADKSKISINKKTGKLTIKKGLKKGNHKFTVTAKNAWGSKKMTVTIKVK
jgi:hypothetical protein